jgi:hypothetical protein
MKQHILSSLLFISACSGAFAATQRCSRANLTRCLDSVCAINLSSNPAARCQYCGSKNAGTPPASKMKSVSVGTSAKYNISEKDLQNAPEAPGERYIWATTQCIAKVPGCTPDDASEAYDKLIEQSCTAAGISAKIEELQAELKKTRTKSNCESEITACVIDASGCTADYHACKENVNFDRVFASCSALSTGCDSFTSEIRTTLLAEHDNAVENTDLILAKIVGTYQAIRDNALANAQLGCENNRAFDECVKTVCNRNMPDKCAAKDEQASAALLCQFHKTACNTLD